MNQLSMIQAEVEKGELFLVKPKDVLAEVNVLKTELLDLRIDIQDRTADRIYRSEVLELLNANQDKLVIPDKLRPPKQNQ